MNLSGVYQYSKSIVPLKSPKIDLHTQFIFIYPMISGASLAKYNQVLRDYISLSFLKEVFISNSIDLISFVSQIPSELSFAGQNISPQSIQTMTHQQSAQQPPGGTAPSYIKGELQYKLQEKLNKIRSLLKNDPILSQFSPHMDIVTLNNLIDVPVIVGTKLFPADNTFLFYLLLISVSQGYSLTSRTNLESCISIMKTLRPDNLMNLFRNINKDQNPSILRRIYNRIFGPSVGNSPALSNSLNNFATKRGGIKEPSALLTASQIQMSTITKNQIIFEKVLDAKKLYSEFGLNTQTYSQKVNELASPKLEYLYEKFLNNFLNMMDSIGNTIFIRFINSISLKTTSIDFLPLQDEFNVDIINLLKEPDIKNMIKFLIEQCSNDNEDQKREHLEKIKTINSLCKLQTSIDDFIKNLLNNYRLGRSEHILQTPVFSLDEYKEFVVTLSNFSNESAKYVVQSKNLLSKIFSENLDNILAKVRNFLIGKIRSITNKYTEEVRDNNNEATIISDFNMLQYYSNWIDSGILYLSYIYQMIFLTSLTHMICGFIKRIEGDIEVASTDVLKWPNYTLIVPLEIILLIYNMMVASSWEKLISPSDATVNSLLSDPSDIYIKRAIKEVNLKSRVPNLIVVDFDNNEIYTNLMMSPSSVNKIKFQNIQNFINYSTATH